MTDSKERALKILQAEAWEDGYSAAIKDLSGFEHGESRVNPFVIWTEE